MRRLNPLTARTSWPCGANWRTRSGSCGRKPSARREGWRKQSISPGARRGTPASHSTASGKARGSARGNPPGTASGFAASEARGDGLTRGGPRGRRYTVISFARLRDRLRYLRGGSGRESVWREALERGGVYTDAYGAATSWRSFDDTATARPVC